MIRKSISFGPVVQLASTPPCHGGGRRFEPDQGRLSSLKAAFALKIGVLAQLGEHLPYKQGVTGSSPVGPSHFLKMRELADVAQLAEQLICNQQVIGSSPIIGFIWMGSRAAKGGRL